MQLHDLGLLVDKPEYDSYFKYLVELMKVNNIKPEVLTVKKGSGLIWSANLVHGGTKIEKPQSTRFSQVTHYYFDNCIYYTPVLSNVLAGEYLHRSSVLNIRTDKVVEQTFNGRPFFPVSLGNGRTHFAIDSRSPFVEKGEKLIANAGHYNQQVEELLQSRSYKLGRALTSPYRILKKIANTE